MTLGRKASSRWVIASSVIVLAAITYVVSIAWRVGVEEDRLFGRNHTLPLITPIRNYKEPATPDSFGSPTFTFVRDGRILHVYKPLINSFQHTFGSALAAFEIGEFLADIMFRSNEYIEAYTKPEGRSYLVVISTSSTRAKTSLIMRSGEQLEPRRALRDCMARQQNSSWSNECSRP